MKIVLISDTHGLHHELVLPSGDVIIHGGDLSRMGTKTQVVDFLAWFANLDFKHKIFIAGNHDFLFDKQSSVARQLVPEGIFYLEDSMIEIEGLKIYGSPITPEFYNWAFMKKRGAEILEVWEKIPEGLDFLITHGPPYGILDKLVTGVSCGCEELIKIVEERRPKYHMFGHIHESYGMIEKDQTVFVNASILDEHYRIAHKPVILEL